MASESRDPTGGGGDPRFWFSTLESFVQGPTDPDAPPKWPGSAPSPSCTPPVASGGSWWKRSVTFSWDRFSLVLKPILKVEGRGETRGRGRPVTGRHCQVLEKGRGGPLRPVVPRSRGRGSCGASRLRRSARSRPVVPLTPLFEGRWTGHDRHPGSSDSWGNKGSARDLITPVTKVSRRHSASTVTDIS